MRKLIFIISILFWFLCLFGVYMSIGMRGDTSLIYAVIPSLLFMVLVPTSTVIAAFRFMAHREMSAENLAERKLQGRQKIYLIIFIILFLIVTSFLTLGREFSTQLGGFEGTAILLICIAWFLIKKWPRILLLVSLLFLFLYTSLLNLGNNLPAKFYLLGISIELGIFIIFLPPLYYLIKNLKR